jgi:hypothetical protein
MKKSIYLIILLLILGLVLTGCTLLSNIGQVPTNEQSGITYLTKGPGTSLFTDDFESYTPGIYPGGVGLDNWQYVSGIPSIVLDTTKVLGITGGSYVGEAVAVTGSPDWQDYILDLDAKKCSGNYFNIVFRYVDSGTYYMVESPSASTHIALWKRVSGTFTQLVLPRPVQPTETGIWYNYKIELRTTPTGTNIKVFVDGVEKFDIIDDTPALARGSVGVGGHGSESRFDNVVVVQYPTIVINGCDTGVDDVLYNGDRISELIKNIYFKAKNHGQFVRGVAVLTNDLMKAGFINSEEKGKIQSCAAQANQLPKEDGLVLWLDAGKGITATSGVSKWEDQSGSGNNAVQATASYQPTYITNELNGYPVVRFNGESEQYLVHSSILIDDYTAFYVLKLNESEGKSLYYYHAGAVNSGDLGFFAEYSSSSLGWGSVGDYPCYPYYFRTSKEYPTGVDWRIHTHQPNALYKNGDEVEYVREDDVHAGGLTTIGSRSDYYSLYFVGDIAEILIYDRILTVYERETVEIYLNAKYDIYY